MREKGHNLLVRTATGAIFVIVMLAATLHPASYAVLLSVIAAGCMTEAWRIARKPVARFAWLLYITVCVTLMWFFPSFGTDGNSTFIAPAFMIVVWTNDILAYLVGISLGKHKMAEKLSPHKSWEGFAGGVIGAVAMAGVIGRFGFGMPALSSMAFGLFVALAAVGGDLAESHLKREAGVKDSGRIFPGHGGFLDRFDAMLGAVPVAFLFFLIVFVQR